MERVLRLITALLNLARWWTHYQTMRFETWLAVRAHVSHGVRHTILRPAFWLGLTLGFPLEHLLWEKLWPFNLVTEWLGL